MPSEPDVLADRYRLTDSIGRGGMADVFAAEDTSSGRMVAVKIMRLGEQADPNRFASEMEILDRLSHPAVVRLFDSGTTDDACPYFVMQLVDGLSLSARLRAMGPLDAEDAADIGARVASALAHAHEMGVIHRDIKPANILVDGDGGAYLSDFGVARLADATLVTRAGTTIGTAAYLAPEQMQDSQVGPGADVYAFGLVMLEALTGRRAFGGTGIEAAMARLSRDPSIPRGLPEPWVQLLVAMTRRAVDRRPDAAVVEGVLRGELDPPETSVEELGARTYDPAVGDDDPTAITESGDTPSQGSSGSGAWGPPQGASGQITVPPVPEATPDPATSPAPQPIATTPPAVPAAASAAVPSAAAASAAASAAQATTPVAAVDAPGALSEAQRSTADPIADSTPTPTPEPPPVGTAADDGRVRNGWDWIRSNTLVVGLMLGAIAVVLVLALIAVLVMAGDPQMVRGNEPVDDAARGVLAVLEASERLSAADPSLQRDLLSLSDGIVQAVNDDTWDVALIGVIDMTEEARAAIDDLDIDGVALDGLLSALRDLAVEIEAAAAAEVESDAAGG